MNKTIKILFSALVVALMLLSLSIPSFAKNSNNLVVDNENLFTTAQQAELEANLLEISEKYQCELVVLTVPDFGYYDSAEDYAENYYDNHGYGYGSDATGALLLISANQRYYHICTTGEAEDIFNRKEINDLKADVKAHLSNDDFYEGALAFATGCEDVLYDYELNGSSFDTDSFLIGVVIFAIIGVIAGIITVLVMKSKMNNAKPQKNATHYVRNGSFDLRVSRDMYLYSTVRRVSRPKSTSSGGRAGGGRSHGGGGGRF